MKRLKHSQKIGRLLVAGALLGGCASTQAPSPAAPIQPAASRPAEQRADPRGECLRRRSGIQECLVEVAMQSCAGQSEEAERRVCIREAIHEELQFPGEERSLSVIINPGDEVLSINVGEFVLFSIVKIEAVSVDSEGVDFRFLHIQSETDSIIDMNPIVEARFRVNFDGSSSGDIHQVSGLEIWNFTVSQVADGVMVRFSTADNRIMTRQ